MTNSLNNAANGSVPLDGKTIVVTGASSGIGLETARLLAGRGAQIVMVCRDARRAAVAREQIAGTSPRAKKPEVVFADFQSLAQVRGAAAEINQRFATVDVLVNNAGAVFARRELTGDGIEKTFAVNQLAPFLLTNLLLGKLLDAAEGRVVTVTSEAYSKRLDFENLQGERSYNFFRAYQHSKLANILFSNELARRLGATAATANAVSPGPTVTRFGNDLTGLPALMPKVMKRIPFLFKPVEVGAAGVIRLAGDPELREANGKFFLRDKEEELKPGAQDAAVADQLWTVCADLARLPAATSAPAAA